MCDEARRCARWKNIKIQLLLAPFNDFQLLVQVLPFSSNHCFMFVYYDSGYTLDTFIFAKRGRQDLTWFDKTIQIYDIVLLLTSYEYQVFNSIFIAKCVGKRQAARNELSNLFDNKILSSSLQFKVILFSIAWTANCNRSVTKSVQLRTFIEVYCLNQLNKKQMNEAV